MGTPQEFESLHTAFSNRLQLKLDTHKEGKRSWIETPQWILFKGAFGKAFAAASCEFAIQRWKPEWVIDFGAAGALVDGIKIGDLFLAHSAIDYDTDYSKYISFKKNVESFLDTYPDRLALKLKTVCIASAEKDVKSITERREISQRLNAQLATWETTAIAKICALHEVKCLSMRTVSDLGDHSEDGYRDEYKQNLEETLASAAKILAQIVTTHSSDTNSQHTR
jgi:adenosylhomocysteine nucleosidase